VRNIFLILAGIVLSSRVYIVIPVIKDDYALELKWILATTPRFVCSWMEFWHGLPNLS
jgi:hypothetical protein